MKQSVYESDFIQAFEDYNRSDNFSYLGLRALYKWLIDLEDDTGEEMELDVIAICCDFTEYENIEEFHKEYDKEDYPNLETLRDHTQVIEFDGTLDDKSFIIQNF